MSYPERQAWQAWSNHTQLEGRGGLEGPLEGSPEEKEPALVERA